MAPLTVAPYWLWENFWSPELRGRLASRLLSRRKKNNEPPNWLPPLFVTTFTVPPAARPYSAEKPFATTWNSWTASWLNVERTEPVDTSLLSRPSTITLLDRGLMPA